MNIDNKNGCLAIVLGIILFILCPVVLILYGLFSAPEELKLFLCAWIVFSILCFTFISDKTIKIVIAIIPTLIYAVSFASWYADDVLNGYYGGGGLGDTIGMFLAPFATLVPLALIGNVIKASIESRKTAKREMRRAKLQIDIKRLEREVEDIQEQLQNWHKIVHILDLLSICGADTTTMKNHPNIDNIYELRDNMSSLQQQIRALNAKL